MNSISFDTYIRRDAYRNGRDNCEPDAEGAFIFSSSIDKSVETIREN